MSFLKRMEEIIDKGVSTSKEVLGKAKVKTKELGEKGTLKVKIMQLEKQAEKNFAKLGTKVYEILVIMEKNTVSKSTPDIKAIIQDITQIEKKIDENEALIKKI